MERWAGRVAVVTGASSGIGAAITLDLVRAGVVVVGLARQQEKIEALREKLAGAPGVLHSYKCDVSVESDILAAFVWIETVLGGVDILVNNAGIVCSTSLVAPNNTTAIREVLETNVMGVVLCTREAFQSMKRRNVAGHIVIINSIMGHMVPFLVGSVLGGLLSSLNIYPSTKHAITAMTEVLRQEFQSEGTKIKISSISPGAVRTALYTDQMMLTLKDLPILEPEDISDAVMYVLRTPPHVQIHELIIKPVGERM